MQLGAERLLHAKERAHRGVPDDAVEFPVSFGVSLRAAIFPLPIAPFDLVHQILIVRMHHQGQTGLSDGFEALEKPFQARAKELNILGIEGHRSVGGFRASIYNAMPIESVQVLVDAMKEFESQN